MPPMGNMPMVNLALAAAPSTGYSTLRIQPTSEQPASSSDDNGAFRVSCGFSHMLNDDPIVYPGKQGAAHHHTFFGNTGTNYASTSESIRISGNSTCNGGIMNRSAYWEPSMIDTSSGAPLRPRNLMVYYKQGPVSVIPRGLRMIAGDHLSSAPQAHQWFECNEEYSSRKPHIVSCGQGGLLTSSVTFPDCWNGKDLDSANHKSHMAYSSDTNNSCPASHPKRIPTITMLTYYEVNSSAGTSKWRLASDNYAGGNGGYSSHADFMMGWDEVIHKTVVDKCINPSKDCHAHLLGDGREFY